MGKDPKDRQDSDQVRKDSNDREDHSRRKTNDGVQNVTDWDKAPRPSRDKDKSDD
jgi:hypothetical protein